MSAVQAPYGAFFVAQHIARTENDSFVHCVFQLNRLQKIARKRKEAPACGLSRRRSLVFLELIWTTRSVAKFQRDDLRKRRLSSSDKEEEDRDANRYVAPGNMPVC